MYALIRAGGKQSKVSEGDIIDVERIKGDGAVSFVPLLIVEKNGTVISDRKVLAKAKVTAEILGESSGPKIDIFKYKAKTGYRRRAGHRQTYTQLRIRKIEKPGAVDFFAAVDFFVVEDFAADFFAADSFAADFLAAAFFSAPGFSIFLIFSWV